jgi:hypothetical protein
MESRYIGAGALICLLASTLSFAQNGTPTSPSTQPTDPSAASSPHQRTVTKSPGDESAATTQGTSPSAASTPHQKKATKKKAKPATPDSPDTNKPTS